MLALCSVPSRELEEGEPGGHEPASLANYFKGEDVVHPLASLPKSSVRSSSQN